MMGRDDGKRWWDGIMVNTMKSDNQNKIIPNIR